ncbi:MAG TPA: AAA family ATPase [Steroidobacteraceae bacterium]|nr:AAA family ATPase [Steroidobacteraceae bacterium]
MSRVKLLERERLLADLAQRLQGARTESGIVVLVGGEAGVGKTLLLREFAAAQTAVRVLWGGCDDLFAPRPLAPLWDVARRTGGALLTALGSGARREDLFALALDELEREPTLVVFEDMHWADEATLDLLKFLGRRIHTTRSMIAVSFRDDEVNSKHPLRGVIGDLPRANMARVSITPLSEAAVAELARAAGRSPEGLYRITAGNPLFVTEVLASGIDSVPATVRDAVLARTARLSPAARQVAELVSVVPGKTELSLVRQALQADDAAIAGCVEVGMVLHDDDTLGFRHELVRRAVEESLLPTLRQSLHAQALRLLAAQSDIPAARLVHHADGARDADAVLRLAPVAAAQAGSVGSHREAAAHFEAALRYGARLSGDERAQLQQHLSYEYYLTGQTEQALAARLEALTHWRSQGRTREEGDTLRWMSRLSWFAGRGADADRYANAAITTLDGLAPGRELAMAYSNQSQLRMLAHDTVAAVSWANRAIELAERLEDIDTLSHALNNRGTSRSMGGDEGGWADLDRSLALALEHGLQEHAARAYTNLSSSSTAARRYEAAQKALGAGLAYCEAHDLDSWRLYMLAWRARLNFERGDWDAASEDAEAVLRHPRAINVSRLPALTVIGHLRVRRGDPDARAVLEEARTLADTTQELQRIGPVAVALADLGRLTDQWEEVSGYVRSAYELAARQRDPWLKGALTAALRAVGELEATPDDIAAPYRLELSRDWKAAANAWSELGCPYETARVLADCGEEPQQLEALEQLQRLGAWPAIAMLRRRMRQDGIRNVPRGQRDSTRSHPRGLTRREAQILALMSESLTNGAIAKRLFLSTRTVDRHVSAILAKLGVASRVAAVKLARRQDDASES